MSTFTIEVGKSEHASRYTLKWSSFSKQNLAWA